VAAGRFGIMSARLFPGRQRAAAHSREWARANLFWQGQLEDIATLTRRILTRTRAPILNSLRRMVPQVALANYVCLRAMRCSAQTSA
jgi:hypothetical protein